MLFNADIRQNFKLEEVNLEKQKANETLTKNMKQTFTLILDYVNRLSNNRALQGPVVRKPINLIQD